MLECLLRSESQKLMAVASQDTCGLIELEQSPTLPTLNSLRLFIFSIVFTKQGTALASALAA